MEFDDQELEYTMHEMAQKDLGTKKEYDVHKLRESMGKNYRSFVDVNTGERVDIDVEEAKEKLYNDSKHSKNNHLSITHSTPTKVKKNSESTPSKVINIFEPHTSINNNNNNNERPTKRKYTKKSHPQKFTYQTRNFFKNQLTKKEFAEVALQRKAGKKSEYVWESLL